MGATDSFVPQLACSKSCQVLDMLADTQRTSDGGFANSPRTLGLGRHPVAGGVNGWLATYLQPNDNPPSLYATAFSAQGTALTSLLFSAGSNVVDNSNPVVGGFPCDKGAVFAWADMGGDGDELGVALRLLSPSTGVSTVPLQFANSTTNGSQFDPDLIVLSSGEVVVAWTDTSDAATQPDLRWRTFDAALNPTTSEQTLAATSDSEGDVALAPFAGSWAAAYRDDSGGPGGKIDAAAGFETIQVVASATTWTLGPPFLPAPADVKPALIALDPSNLLVVYAVGVDAGDSGVATGSALQVAVLNVDSPQPVSVQPLVGTLSTQPQSSPALASVNGQVYLAWWTAAALGDPLGEENWLKPLPWANATLDLTQPEISLPRWNQARKGDQRAPAIVALPDLPPGGAIGAAWDDLGMTFGRSEGTGDTAAELIPLPILRAATELCAPGWVDCDGNPDNGCETDPSTSTQNCGTCGNACSASDTCYSGHCVVACTSVQTRCEGTCTNTASDPQNCSACGVACLTDVPNAQPACASSSCTFACDSGYSGCPAASPQQCVNEQDDTNNCGACANKCPSAGNGTAVCNNGACGVLCNGTLTYCSGEDACENLQGDPNNCGACGKGCTTSVANAAAACSSGSCGFSCNSGFSGCPSAAPTFCANEQTDDNNCGACGKWCPSIANGMGVCNGGACGISCSGGLSYCSAQNACDNLQSDPNNCGTCGKACTTSIANAAPTCTGAACSFACDTGFSGCPTTAPTACVNEQNDANNCGSCGGRCLSVQNGTPSCNAGICSFSCNSGFTFCTAENACVNEQTDVNNCGACGHECPSSLYGSTVSCVGGTCDVVCPTGATLCPCNPGEVCPANATTECVSESIDVFNCGGCGNVCASVANGNTTCNGATCGFTCHSGFSACPSSSPTECTNEQTDVNNCGACGKVCPAVANGTATCNGATCGASCNSGYLACVSGSSTTCIPAADTVNGAFISAVHGTTASGCGSESEPCLTVSLALSNNPTKTIFYVDGDGGTSLEQVTLRAGVTIEGGWTDTSGSWSNCTPTTSTIEAPSGDTSVIVASYAGSSTLENITLVNSTTATAGESLYGILATGTTTSLTLSNVTIRVAAGGAGIVGSTGATATAPAASCTASTGANGTAGTAGSPGAASYTSAGYQPATGGAGTAGTSGTNGTAGGGSSEEVGTCTVVSGHCTNGEHLVTGQSGAPGCASGGAGGGTGGVGGGASIGIFAWGATVALATGSITTGAGGTGGAGGPAGATVAGTAGTAGATVVARACGCGGSTCACGNTNIPGGAAGGTGGTGGAGGKGAGGSGGDSHCYVQGGGATVTWNGTCTTGTAGAGGSPGGAAGNVGLHN